MRFRTEINGLRAVAVIAVILFHAKLKGFSGGFIGVDVFFVISGFLITTLIQKEFNDGTFSLIKFYERRVRRLFPALFFVTLSSNLVAWILLPSGELRDFSKTVAAVPLLLSNFLFLRDGNYFETSAELKPLLHTWSLAVEGQYYIIFPLFMVLIYKWNKEILKSVVWSVLLASFIWAQIGGTQRPISTFYLLPGRVWEICLGSIIALYPINESSLYKRVEVRGMLALFGLLVVIVSVLTFDSNTPFPGFYALFPTVGTALIIIFADKNTCTGQLLGTPVLAGIGAVSYSAYLWHQPILAFSRVLSRNHSDEACEYTVWPQLALLGLLVALSVFSWKYLESPFRRVDLFSQRFIFIACSTASLLLVSLGVWISTARINSEEQMAKALVHSEAIYGWNMDERKFVKARVEHEQMAPEIIVIGSSRLMQINRNLVQESLLNLSVSSATVEDYVAIWNLVSSKFRPKLVMIGAEPWLFNEKEENSRWKAIGQDYYYGLRRLGMIPKNKSNFTYEKHYSNTGDIADVLFKYVNRSSFGVNAKPSRYLDKILKDGSRVYNHRYSSIPSDEVERTLNVNLYLVKSWQDSESKHEIFVRLIAEIQKRCRVALVLMPVHPKLYDSILLNDDKHIYCENEFREIAMSLGVDIIGSYNPKALSFNGADFYDGIHPKRDSIKKVLEQLKL